MTRTTLIPDTTLFTSIIHFSLFMALAFWILEAYVDTLFIGDTSFVTRLFPADSHELWMRSVICALIAGFGIYCGYLNWRIRTIEKLNLDAEDWLETSSFPCASKDASIYVAYSKSLEQRNPPVAKFLSQMELDPAVVNQWILQIGRDKMDPRDVAEEWVKNNMDTVNGWIN